MRKAEEAAREDSQGKREAFKLEDLKCEHCHAVAEEMVGCCRSMHLATTKTGTAPPLFLLVAITAITGFVGVRADRLCVGIAIRRV